MPEFQQQMCALVTGSTRGIGSAIALQLAERGCRVAIHGSSDIEVARGVCAALPGSNHHAVAGDLSTLQGCKSVFTDALRGLGKVDLLFLNAGIYSQHAINGCDLDTWHAAWSETVRVNLLGASYISKLTVDEWLSRPERGGGGRIFAIGSRGATRGEPYAPAYAASKAGLVAMVQSLAIALGPHGAIASAVAPGVVETDMTRSVLAGPRGDQLRAESPLGRVATSGEIASIAVWLALDALPIISGSVVDANGASHLR